MRPLSQIVNVRRVPPRFVLRSFSVLMMTLAEKTMHTEVRKLMFAAFPIVVRDSPIGGHEIMYRKFADVWWRNHSARRLKGFCQASAARDLRLYGGAAI